MTQARWEAMVKDSDVVLCDNCSRRTHQLNSTMLTLTTVIPRSFALRTKKLRICKECNEMMMKKWEYQLGRPLRREGVTGEEMRALWG